MSTRRLLAIAASTICTAVLFLPEGQAQRPAPPPVRDGALERIKVHGKSLEGNLEGDSPDRDVLVYLPPSYASSPARRYPVIYFLHGYGAHAETYWNSLAVASAADEAAKGGSAREMIVVLPDAYTVYDGSMFSNSPTTGDWETFIAQDLTAIMNANLGLNPQNDGQQVIINVPMLTEERRKQLVKQVGGECEHGKVSIRNIRKETNEQLRKIKGVSEDDVKNAEDTVQKFTDEFIAKIDALMKKKEVEIMTI
jgi:hypothetical protein